MSPLSILFRTLFPALTLTLSVTACDSQDERRMRSSLNGQLTALCNNALFEFGEFQSRADRLGLSADGGAYITDPAIDAELVDESWVASTGLGSRTTIWRGRFGPGEINYRSIVQVNSSSRFSAGGYERRSFEMADVCVAHAPHLTRADGQALRNQYGLTADDMWSAARNANGDPVATSYRRILSVYPREWHEIEFIVPAQSGETGVTIVRRYFMQSETQIGESSAPDLPD
jgi:hypothetical protein